MNKWVAALCVAVLMCSAAAFAVDEKTAPSPVFERLKTLVGDWEAKDKQGNVITNSYRLTSGGSVLMQTTVVPHEGEMVTMFHRDGQAVIGTHYCIARNQPRYTIEPGGDPKVLNLKFKDATNLATPQSGHMDHGWIRFDDPDHYTAQFVWLENGKEQADSLTFARKK